MHTNCLTRVVKCLNPLVDLGVSISDSSEKGVFIGEGVKYWVASVLGHFWIFLGKGVENWTARFWGKKSSQRLTNEVSSWTSSPMSALEAISLIPCS